MKHKRMNCSLIFFRLGNRVSAETLSSVLAAPSRWPLRQRLCFRRLDLNAPLCPVLRPPMCPMHNSGLN